MKKKIFLMLALALMLSCLFVISASAEVTTYEDAPTRSNIQIKQDEIIEFNDGFKCPSAYVFKDVTSIGYNGSFEGVMDFTYINGKVGKAYTYADVKGFDIPSGFTSIGQYAGRDAKAPSWITFPSTVTFLGNAIFQGSTTLEKCTLKFDENHPLTNFPAYMFYGCTKLTAFSMPDCFTTIYDMAHFTNSSALTAVYLSKNLTTWQTQGGSYPGTFDGCGKMYFVNEPFTYDNIPAKPDVYYFPEGLTPNAEDSKDFSNQCPMRNCSSINSTLVFGEKVTRFNNAYFLQNSKVNIVFLGDMDVLAMGNGGWYQTTNYFANPADKSTDDVTISTYSASKAVFCNADGNTTHLAEPKKAKVTDATCTTNKIETTYCFCGALMGTSEVADSALGHNHDVANGATLVNIIYAKFDENGYKVVKCSRCEVTDESTVADPILSGYKGFSTPDSDTAKGITFGYDINKEALREYEEYNAKLEMGFVVAVNAYLNGSKPLDDGVTAKVINAKFTDGQSAYNRVDFVLKGDIWDTEVTVNEQQMLAKDVEFFMSAYVIADGNVSYINEAVTSYTNANK